MRRTANQILADCRRCETAKGDRCSCKYCEGQAHGSRRGADHDLKSLLTQEDFTRIADEIWLAENLQQFIREEATNGRH